MKRYVKRKVKDLKVGDKILNSDKTVGEINYLWPIHKPNEMFLIEFEDGMSISCGDTHLWYCETKEDLLYYNRFKEMLKKIKIEDNPEKELMTINPLAKKLAKNKEEFEFYYRALESLGWDSELNKTYRLYDKLALMNYLREMKDGKIDIRVGKVRTTKEIFELYNKGIEVEFPNMEV